MKPLNTNGEVFNIKEKFYPLQCKKVSEQHPQHFDNNFIFRTMVSNKTHLLPKKNDIHDLLDLLVSKNDTKAFLLLNHENEHISSFVNAYLKGTFDNIDFNVTETKE